MDLSRLSAPDAMASETTVHSASDASVVSPAAGAERLGTGPRRLLLLAAASDGARAGRLVLELARCIGAERSRTLLLNLAGPEMELDRLVGAEARPGLTAAFRGDARMVDVAVREDGEPFHCFPAGAGAAPAGALLSSEAMAHLLRRARAGGATVLLFAPGAALPHEDALPDMDASLLVGSARRSRAPAGVPLLGRLSPRDSAGPEEGRATPELSPTSPGSGISEPWDETELVGTPVASGLAAVASGGAGARRVRSRCRQVAVLCTLALGLGFLIAWVGAHDLWQEWLQWSTEVKGHAAR